MKLRNQSEINGFVAGEATARAAMLPNYSALGLKVISTKGTPDQDLICAGIASGKQYRVEEKYRTVDYGDFLIELWQDIVTAELGWYYKTRADLLSYVICDKSWTPQRCYIVYWHKFKEWWAVFLANEKHPRAIVSPRGIGLSLNLAVTWSSVPCSLYVLRTIPPPGPMPTAAATTPPTACGAS